MEQVAEVGDSSAYEVEGVGLVEGEDRSGDADDYDEEDGQRPIAPSSAKLVYMIADAEGAGLVQGEPEDSADESEWDGGDEYGEGDAESRRRFRRRG